MVARPWPNEEPRKPECSLPMPERDENRASKILMPAAKPCRKAHKCNNQKTNKTSLTRESWRVKRQKTPDPGPYTGVCASLRMTATAPAALVLVAQSRPTFDAGMRGRSHGRRLEPTLIKSHLADERKNEDEKIATELLDETKEKNSRATRSASQQSSAHHVG